MSYNSRQDGHHGGGGGGRRNNRDRRDRDHQHHGQEPPDRKLKSAILKFADHPDSEPADEIPRLAKFLRENLPVSSTVIAEGLRLGVTEQPYKIPYYAAVVAYLYADAPGEAEGGSGMQAAVRAVMEDFVKGFQVYLDELKWLQLRLCIHFFAHLVAFRAITAGSFLGLLQSFIIVLDEPGVAYFRARSAALCAGEALLRCGSSPFEHDASAVNGLIGTLKLFTESQNHVKPLVTPIVRLHEKLDDASDSDECRETLAALCKALSYLQASSFSPVPACLPQPQRSIPSLEALTSSSEPPAEGTTYELPFVLVPPDPLELDEGGIGAAPGPAVEDGKPKAALRSEVPSVYLKLFEDDITPGESSPSDYVVRVCLQDMLEVFEVNRKEAARLLLELPRWWDSRTFKSRHDDGDSVVAEGSEPMDWVLETTLIETVLSTAFLLPISPHLRIYYYALITDLCKLSPTTVGPAVGKSIRKLYKLLEDSATNESGGLDVEAARRFAEWFSVHMSNFAFNWVWKEWIPDLSLSPYHPRRRFIHRAIELELRASYFDRIKDTLPVDYHDAEARALPETAPGPSFDYEDTAHPMYDRAESLLALIRNRSTTDVVLQHATKMCEDIASGMNFQAATSAVRSIVVQVVLHVGARSFSHFLNAIERYLPLLRYFSKETDAKAEILDTAARFWQRNSQMVGIVFDKLMQYQIVDPSDVVAWSFRSSNGYGDQRVEGSIGTLGWEILKAALDKASGRVTIAKLKVHRVKMLAEDMNSQLKAKEGAVVDEGMEVDVNVKDDTSESPAMINAQKALTTLTRDQKTALVRALDGFVSYLGSSPGAATILTKESWASREHWGAEEWDSWETWGWFRHFCRAYAPQLRTYMNTLEAVSLSKLDSVPGVDANAAAMVRRVWNIALGGE